MCWGCPATERYARGSVVSADLKLRRSLLSENKAHISKKSKGDIFGYTYLKLARLHLKKERLKSMFYSFRSITNTKNHLKENLYLIFKNSTSF